MGIVNPWVSRGALDEDIAFGGSDEVGDLANAKALRKKRRVQMGVKLEKLQLLPDAHVGLGSADLTFHPPPHLPPIRLPAAVIYTGAAPPDLCGGQWSSWLLYRPAPAKGKPHFPGSLSHDSPVAPILRASPTPFEF